MREVWLGVGCALTLMGGACERQRDCSNRACTCHAGDDCVLSCDAPPCNVTCEERASCDATCANGSCSCDRHARCDFECKAPPCHVQCGGDNPQCDGTCANGTCSCGTDSSCLFRCDSGPCHSVCPSGASCVVLCPHAPAGSQDCDILECWTGEPTLCPGLGATVCNASCPEPSDPPDPFSQRESLEQPSARDGAEHQPLARGVHTDQRGVRLRQRADR